MKKKTTFCPFQNTSFRHRRTNRNKLLFLLFSVLDSINGNIVLKNKNK